MFTSKKFKIVYFPIIAMLFAFSSYGQTTFQSIGPGNWNNPAIWSGAFGSDAIPGADDNVTINHQVSISDPVEIGNLTIAIGGNLTLANTLTIGGNWANNGNFTPTSAAYVIFNNPTTPQSISGTSVTNFLNLTLDKNGSNVVLGNDIRISGILSFLTDGNIVTGSSDVIFSDAASISPSNPPSAKRMIQQTGSASGGQVIKEWGGSFSTFTFPIGGSGEKYTPFTISSLEASFGTSYSVGIRGVVIPAGGSNIVNRYFAVTSTNISNITDAGLTFTYVESDEIGTPTLVSRMENGNKVEATGYFGIPLENKFGTNPGAGNTFLDTDWYFEKPATPQTYYSYQSGSWSDPNVWTTDPTGATLSGSPGIGGPNNSDVVIILSGRTVLMDENSKTLASVTINNGGIINIATTTGHTFGTVAGQGTIKISSDNIPFGTYTDFVSSIGGTFEFNNAASFTLPASLSTYRNLTINLASSTVVATQINNLTLNGKLLVSSGEFKINNDVSTIALTLDILGDVEVGTNGKISVGLGNTLGIYTATTYNANYGHYNSMYHNVRVYGNLLNNGNIRFTNQSVPEYDRNSTVGAAVIYFKGLSNNTAILNGITDFYNLIVDKGSDRTYTLTINSSTETNFRLFGRNNLVGRGINSLPTNTKDPNPEIRKALWIKNGILRLTGQILIPSLTEGGIFVESVEPAASRTERDPNGDFHIPSNGGLWIDGAGVKVFGTIKEEVNTPPLEKFGTGYNNSSTEQGNSVIGLFKITSGVYDSRNGAGLVFWSVGYDSKMEISGGQVIVTQIRAGNNDGKISYVQTGGDVHLEGRAKGATNSGSGTLGFNNASHVFIMSGGNIYINDIPSFTTPPAFKVALQIASSPANYSVTGGQITVNLKGAADYGISTTSNLFDVVINRTSGTANALITGSPLVISNNLTINSNTTLSAGGMDLTLKGNFTNNGTYAPGTNTTSFNSASSNQIIELNPGSTTSFNNLFLDNTFSGGGLSISGTIPSKNLTINGSLTLSSGTFNINDFVLNVSGNVVNSVVQSGTGRIKMVSSGTLRTIAGNGNGVFGILELDNTSGFSMTANQSIVNSLVLTNGVLDVAGNRLSLGSAATINVTAPNSGRMIRTAGNRNDLGVSKTFTASTGTFLFPVGTGNDYTPIQTAVTAATYGTITARPVSIQHPVLTVPLPYNEALTYYWRLTDAGFAGVTSVSTTFHYFDADVPDLALEGNYITGRYSAASSTWSSLINSVNTVANTFTYTNASLIEGEYTAGNVDAFGGVTLFQSRQNGFWEVAGTWERVQGNTIVESPSTLVPTAGDPVRIKNGTTVIIRDNATVNSGSLEIETTGVLDLGNTMENGIHNFGTLIGEDISGNGKIRISSSSAVAKFPAGDFSQFINVNGGTVEFYGTGANFTLPLASIAPTSLSLVNYNNLILTPNGITISLPAQNLTIHNDLTFNGNGGTVNISNSASGNLNIIRDLTVSNNSSLRLQNGIARTISVGRNLNIDNGCSLLVNNSTGVANMINISGNLTNNGTLDLNNGSGYADVTFAGNTDNSLTGNGVVTEFNRLILNKGIGQVSTLEVTSTAFSLLGPNNGTLKSLDLQNGIFRYSTTPAVNINSGVANSNFTIPSTAQLHITSGTFNITAGGTTYGLILAGKLRLSNSGTLNITGGSAYIEIAGAGFPSIEINDDATLNVGAQIRRSASVSNGSLQYIQTGGNLVLGSLSVSNTTRGMLEIINTGSSFNMSGGTITFVRGNGSTSVPSLYFNPSIYNVTGGTIQIGNGNTTPSQTFLINTTAPLYNLTIASSLVTASLNVNNLTLLGSLTNGVGTLTSNNLNLSIAGDFTNNGTYNAGINTTTFNGSLNNQNIGGASLTVFDKLTINNTFSTGTVNITSSAINVNGELTITAGTLNDNGNVIVARGNVYNSAFHTSTGSGKLEFAGTSQQTINGSGNGTFGNIELNNPFNVRANASLNVNGIIAFTNGILSIDKYLLTLGTNSNFAGALGTDRKIRTNGVISDLGIIKNFAAGTFDFTFPIGSPGKYTPARYAGQTTAIGSIHIKPITVKHPSTTNPANTELIYYWHVESTGFAGLNVVHSYTYEQVDANGNGNESSYEAARLIGLEAPTWDKGPTLGNVNENINEIIIDGGTSGVNFISGDYTAGEALEFGTLLPYVSTLSGGPWNAPTSWEANVVPPTGSRIIIQEGVTITIPNGVNSLINLSILLEENSTLDLGSSFGHSFGTVTGTGKIIVNSGNFPAGDYNAFTTNEGGTIEFHQSGYTLPEFAEFHNVIVNSTGTLNTPANDITINNDLTIVSGALDNFSNRNIIMKGNWLNNGSFVPNTGTVIFNGSTNQSIGGSSQTSFNSLTINNGGGNILLNETITISGHLGLTAGKILISDATKMVTFLDNATSTGGNSTSFIDGKARKIGNDEFVFPLGKGSIWARVRMFDFANFTAATEFTAEYFDQAPPAGSIAAEELERVSDIEYWDLTRGGNSNAACRVELFWEDSERSKISDLQNPIARTDLSIAHLNGTSWENMGGSGTPNGAGGSISTASRLTSFSPITFASDPATEEDPGVNPLPIIFKEFTVALLKEPIVELKWKVTDAEAGIYTIQRSSDGITFEDIYSVEASASAKSSFNHKDIQPLEGTSYYRIYFEGINLTDYSNIERITIGDKKSEFVKAVYPNPNNGNSIFVKTNLSQKDIFIRIVNTQNVVIKTITASTDNTGKVEISNLGLKPGFYIVSVTSDHINSSKKIIVE